MEESYELGAQEVQRIATSVNFTETFTKNPRLYNSKYAFELLTDANAGQALAKIFSLDGVNVIQDFAILKYKWDCLDGAKAGYEGDCTPFEDHYYFDFGPCIVECQSGGLITGGTPATGTVGTAYSHTVTSSGLTGSVSMSGLPPGLSASAGVISGTPTTAGQYMVIVTGTATKTGPTPVTPGDTCTIKTYILITIEET